MRTRIRGGMAAVAALLPLLAAACGGVVCENPASDGATTVVDERLIGFWRPDSGSGGEGDEAMLVVGRRPGNEEVLEVLHVTLERGTVLQSQKQEVRPTAIGDGAWASLRNEAMSGDGAPRKETWSVMRYEMPDASTLKVIALDEKTVAEEVRGGLGGTVEETKGADGKVSSVLVTLSLTTDALRGWLEKRGDAVLAKDRPLVLRRVRMR